MAKVQVWSEKIHPMDSGSLQFEIEVEGHVFSYRQVWENCGEIHEDFTCSCGFSTTEAPGRGCWQWGHNEPSKARLDATHAALLLLGAHEARWHGEGYPAEWGGLERMALEALESTDFGLDETLKFLYKRSGALTAAQLRKLLAGELNEELKKLSDEELLVWLREEQERVNLFFAHDRFAPSRDPRLEAGAEEFYRRQGRYANIAGTDPLDS